MYFSLIGKEIKHFPEEIKARKVLVFGEP